MEQQQQEADIEDHILEDPAIKRTKTIEERRRERKALCCSLLSLIVSIPALIGA
jgi:hypothetical protein